MPDRGDFPATWLSALHVTFTGHALGARQRGELQASIVRHGGTCLTSLEPGQTTHLVCANVGGEKYRAAASLGIPVVSAEFVHACVRAEQVVDAAPYLLGPFAGLQITISNIVGAERQELVRAIKAGGGVYQGAMELGNVTHLVLRNPTGDKYLRALEWHVPIVSPEWVQRCIACSAWQEEGRYLVRAAAANQGENEERGGNAQDGSGHLSLSVPPQGRANTGPECTSGISAATATMLLPAEAGGKEDARAEEELERCARAIRECEAAVRAASTSGAVSRALHGCVVYVCGVDKEELRRDSRLLVTLCDGVVAWECDRMVTHVLVGPDGEPDKPTAAAVRRDCPAAQFVRLEWLLASHSRQSRAPARDFAWQPPAASRPASELKRVRSATPPMGVDEPASLRGLTVCVSRYEGRERAEVERLCAGLGAVFTDRLIKNAAHVLICKDDQGEKFRAAVEWKVKYIRTLEWLRRCAAAAEEDEPRAATRHTGSVHRR